MRRSCFQAGTFSCSVSSQPRYMSGCAVLVRRTPSQSDTTAFRVGNLCSAPHVPPVKVAALLTRGLAVYYELRRRSLEMCSIKLEAG